MSETCVIIGLGNIGMGYDYNLDAKDAILTHARSFSVHPDFELLGAVDSDLKKCAAFETEYGVRAFSDLDEAFSNLKPSVVVIATPSNSHYSVAKKITEFYCPKAIVCEKPLDQSLEFAKLLTKMCSKMGIQLYVNYMRRSETGANEIKVMIEEGVIQKPIKATVWYSKGLLNNGSHMLNLLEYWLGETNQISMINSGRSWQENDPEPDFFARFEEGSAIFLSAWEEFFPHLTIEIVSPSGRLYYSRGGNEISWQPSKASKQSPKTDFLSENLKINTDLDHYQFQFTKNLSLALQGKESFISTGSDALSTLKNVYKVMEKRT